MLTGKLERFFIYVKNVGLYNYTEKKNQIFLIYKEIQNGSVAKSYMTNGFLIYGEIFARFLIHDFAIAPL
jgi:hypothetical protein